MGKSVVILGGSFAGLVVAHKLLKYTHKAYPDFKVTIVTPSTHLYWNIAAVRHILPSPHCFADDELFSHIAPGFERYPRGSFELVVGTAQSIDEDKNEVYVKVGGGGSMTFHYTALVVCTGSTYADAAYWKSTNTGHHEIISQLDEVRAKIEAAKDIVLGGAGPTGVEVAAELGATYGKNGSKTITLVTSGNRILDQKGVRADISKTAEKVLESQKVKIIKGARVESHTAPEPAAEGAEAPATTKTEVKLSNGTTLTTDLYIPVAGVRATTSFLPERLLAPNGDLKVTSELVAEASASRSIWGAGDVTNLEGKQIVYAQSQAEHLAANLDAMLRGRSLKPYVPKGKTQLFVSLGKGNGTAQFGNFKLPGMMVSYIKSRNLLAERTEGVATGQKLPMGGNL